MSVISGIRLEKKVWSGLAFCVRGWCAGLAMGLLGIQAAAAGTVVSRVTPGGGMPSLTWESYPLGVYRVWRSENAAGPYDTQVGGDVTATGYTTTLTDPQSGAAGSRRYYRIETVSPGYANYLILDVSGGTNAASWPVVVTNAVPDLLTDPAYRTTKVVLKLIGAGSFKMFGLYDVTLTRPFYIGVFELTQDQCVNMTGSAYASQDHGATRPANNFSFADLRGGTNDAAGWGWPADNLVAPNSLIGRLRAKTGSDNFDLPTSAQWEYASRAGTTTDFYNGTDANPSDGTDFSMVTNIARCKANNDIPIDGQTGHAPVGSYLPNAWGIYDTHGNVAELLLDREWTGAEYAGTDPLGPTNVNKRVFRGGQSKSPNTSYLKNTLVNGADPEKVYVPGVMGSRLVLRLPEDETLGQVGAEGGENAVITRVDPVAVPMITWASLPDAVYGVFRSESPTGPFETQIGENLTGTGGLLSVMDDSVLNNAYHYRVEQLASGYARYMIVDVSAGSGATSWPVSYTNVLPELLTDNIYKTDRIVLKLLPPDTYTMRQPVNTGVPVTLTRPFYAGVFEVTRAQYTRVTGISKGTTAHPVGDVSYTSLRGGTADGIDWPTTANSVAAGSFMGLLRAKTASGGKTLLFDLPTDAQWEYACRAGTSSHFNNGRNAASKDDWAAINDIAWHKNNSGGGAQLVGLLNPNGFGLYDMHGNITEFCLDWSWNGPTAHAVDPTGPTTAADGKRIYRGGTYSSPNLSTLYSSTRGGFFHTQTQGNIGFRLYCQLPEEAGQP